MERGISLLGLFVFVGISYLCSVNRQAVRWHPVLWGIGLQFILAVLILKTQAGFALFEFLGNAVSHFLNFSDQGAKFVFGEDFQDHFIAFKVLPTIIFFSSFISILYHYKILQKIVEAVAWVMMRTLKTSGSETLSCSANIFIGQTEAPLLIKPYIHTLTNSELHAVMTGGFATIAGGVMAAYISFGIPAEHILAASVMSAPAALAISKIFYPETEISLTKGKVKIEVQPTSANGIDAAATGASDGMKLALNVAAMLIAFLGLLALINGVLQWLGSFWGMPSLSLEGILGYLFAPVAWLMGIPIADCLQVGVLLGKKTVLNEFIAYLDLKQLIENSQQLAQGKGGENSVSTISDRAIIISTYALCGFSNIGSIAIQIGGISAIAPERQADVARLGIRAMIAGSIACFMTACIAGILL
ncbi:NupC/NupG family nucleoside CNT transporter [Planktothrix agardhii 1029]|uniref:NupC/NupG family nucleoside CNT transporter n=1 Tax=Planktothrix agardhii TaxID=1160 RepID=UPI001D0A869B|nr:NupC/NupG family nucleoside CNT transporter [Planktothrix agardhii]MCB8762620.1 NupC/NupG family nucleoside CNT transporter [Planktothrix agardhii 1809]MCB8763596.1 NupC/NupG family nucleoside CNT transporter [Planktothrix agardhii 1809]MCB8776215.1 NupC/NupG family nucleoside CNT transporter [Planktothrix agardhii 1031]MCB8780640.1 NupC/NupG family nucleoside CNT transporter [Planktothrix agardhii 1808]MCF3568171.1 NupC/NupG family nucleoside CNT transporter [Planktothrix agardhii 1807]